MRTLLALETSTDACSAALIHGATLFERFELASRQHAELMLAMIEGLLQEAQLKMQQIEAIAVGAGPGSFMGIRIGSGIAQGLALGLQCPVIPISTLQICAQNAYETWGQTNVVVAWDAHMGAIYYAQYQLDQHQFMRPVYQDALLKPADLFIPELGHWCLVGNAWKVYGEELKSIVQHENIIAIHTDCYPTARALAHLAQHELKNNRVVTAAEAQPVYLWEQIVKAKI